MLHNVVELGHIYNLMPRESVTLSIVLDRKQIQNLIYGPACQCGCGM